MTKIPNGIIIEIRNGISDPEYLDTEEDAMTSKEFFYRLATAIYRIDNAYDRFAKDGKLKPNTMWVLYALSDGKAHSQRTLCKEWQFARSTLNTIVGECVRDGLVTLEQIEGERRELEIRLTQKGREYSAQVLAPVYEAESRLYESFFGGKGDEFVKGLEAFGNEMERQYSVYGKEGRT